MRGPLAALTVLAGLAGAGVIALRDGSPNAPPAGRTATPPPRDPDDAPGPDGLTGRQRRGKQIYLHGTSPSGAAITATLGPSADQVPASLVACGNCHGRDGRGRAEGGIDPADLSWAVLTRPRAADARRARPAYTPDRLARAVTLGLNPAGEPMGVGMPRYQLSTADLGDLLAYWRVLGTEPDPGVTPDAVRVGTLLPPAGTAPGLGETIADTLRACVAELNARGGVYQRRIVLEAGELPETASGLAAFLKGRDVFALVAPYVAGREEAFAGVVREDSVPVIGPFGYGRPASDGVDRTTFLVHPDLGTQARALAIAATRETPPTAPAVVRGDDPVSAAAAEDVADAWERACGVAPARFVVRGDAGEAALARLVEALARLRTDALLYLGPAHLARPLTEAAGRASWRPRVYAPGASWDLRDDRPTSFGGRVVLALPFIPDDVSRSGGEELDRLRARYNLPPGHDAVRFAVLAAFKVLEEGLKRSGRMLTRAGLVDELARLEGFETGFARPLTFGPTRRVGSSGAYLMALDAPGRRLRPLGWTGAGAAP
jgi:ABC-type branched-subunit amino acid transport system substrate-binding protein